MPTIHFKETATATPEQFVAVLTDFGPVRLKVSALLPEGTFVGDPATTNGVRSLSSGVLTGAVA